MINKLPWIFPACTRILLHTVPRITQAIHIPSGEIAKDKTTDSQTHPVSLFHLNIQYTYTCVTFLVGLNLFVAEVCCICDLIETSYGLILVCSRIDVWSQQFSSGVYE